MKSILIFISQSIKSPDLFPVPFDEVLVAFDVTVVAVTPVVVVVVDVSVTIILVVIVVAVTDFVVVLLVVIISVPLLIFVAVFVVVVAVIVFDVVIVVVVVLDEFISDVVMDVKDEDISLSPEVVVPALLGRSSFVTDFEVDSVSLLETVGNF